MLIVCKQCKELKGIYCRGLCQKCFKRNRQAQAPKILCGCGCGELISCITIDGNPAKYKIFHHRNFASRDKQPNWKNGRRRSGPYMKVLRKHHKYADSKGYVWEHRYYMELELGRYLTKIEVVHHIDGNCLNNDINNLMLFPNHSEHLKYELDFDTSDRRCGICGSSDTYINKNGKPVWFIKDNNFICQKCRDRIRYDLKRKNIWRKKQ